jgi:hypothetical protein
MQNGTTNYSRVFETGNLNSSSVSQTDYLTIVWLLKMGTVMVL